MSVVSTIVFLFSEYSFTVQPDVYFESHPTFSSYNPFSRDKPHCELPLSFIASRTQPHFIDCGYVPMYSYMIHILHPYTADTRVHQARARIRSKRTARMAAIENNKEESQDTNI